MEAVEKKLNKLFSSSQVHHELRSSHRMLLFPHTAHDHSPSLNKCRCVYLCGLPVRKPQEISMPIGLWKGYALESFINFHSVHVFFHGHGAFQTAAYCLSAAVCPVNICLNLCMRSLSTLRPQGAKWEQISQPWEQFTATVPL